MTRERALSRPTRIGSIPDDLTENRDSKNERIRKTDLNLQSLLVPDVIDPTGQNEVASSSDKSPTWEVARLHKNAVLWSAFMSLGSINWGLDALLSVGVIAVPSFQQSFGYLFRDTYIISYGWLIAFNTSSAIGGLLGAIATGYLSDKVGRTQAMGFVCITSIGSVLMQVFAQRSSLLLAGKLINGLCLGCFLSIPSTYAAEICPSKLRGLATSGVQLCIVIGQLAANCILKGTGTLDSSLAYKIPFALQLFFPVCLLIGLPFCPESPWFLIRSHRTDDAIKTLRRLGYPSPTEAFTDMSNTIMHDDSQSSGASYLDCFCGTDRRRTEIAMGIMTVSQLSGVVFVIGYSSYFFRLAGLSASSSFSLSVGVTLLGVLGVICSWALIDTAGRRLTTFVGVCILTFLLFLIGLLDVLPSTNRGAKGPVYGQVASIIVFAFVFLLTIGPTSYTLFAEISSPRLRTRTVGLGIVVQSLFNILLNIVIPLMINPDAAALRGKIGFIFGATSLLTCFWVWFRVPETKNRDYRELDELFRKKVPARSFQHYHIT